LSTTIGKWRLIEADIWGKDYLDMLEPAFIEFQTDGYGGFRFGCVVARLECEYSPTTVHFRWHGFDEMDEVSGDGFAERLGNEPLAVEISFHNGDDANLKGRKW
jgi:hypothetical protein